MKIAQLPQSPRDMTQPGHRSFRWMEYCYNAARDQCLAAIDDEPEYPGDMPDEMWEAIQGDRDAMQEALRITVKLTKQGIRERITG